MDPVQKENSHQSVLDHSITLHFSIRSLIKGILACGMIGIFGATIWFLIYGPPIEIRGFASDFLWANYGNTAIQTPKTPTPTPEPFLLSGIALNHWCTTNFPNDDDNTCKAYVLSQCVSDMNYCYAINSLCTDTLNCTNSSNYIITLDTKTLELSVQEL